LSRIKDGRIATLTSANGLPCDASHWLRKDDEGFVWLYMLCGLVRIAKSELNAWESDPKHIIQSTTLDSSAGVYVGATAVSGYAPRVAKTADGKFWFVGGAGVSILDPQHLI